ncbi:phosphodiester glycosidase family protein [Deinococcus lacus]|uniref:Phosphodiester glycosidase family protein n=1 Tax=Deinococcus lacus TaxID=392561 RepID=A0ABW1YCW3_9DEIO
MPLNRARSGGNFALRPNGVFWVQGTRAGILETDAYAAARLRPEFATQSGPLLVQRGQIHPAFGRDSTSRKYRSGVGVCQGDR